MKAAVECEVFDMARVGVFRALRLLPGPRCKQGLPPSCWCARITGADPRYGLAREFIRGLKDYDRANGTQSRGVFMYYTLETGHYYEVKRQYSWKNYERFFCRVTDEGDVVRVEKEEVIEWAKKASE